MLRKLEVKGLLQHTVIHPPVDQAYVLRNKLRPGFWSGWLKVWLSRTVARITKLPVCWGQLQARVLRDGQWIELGVLSYRVITDAGLEFLTDALQSGAEDFTTFNWHACGTDNTAEAAGDTALGSETVTPVRREGTKSQPTSTSIDFTATQTFVGPVAVVEHGLFSASTSGTLWDRSVFATINVDNPDAIQWVYTLTLSS